MRTERSAGLFSSPSPPAADLVVVSRARRIDLQQVGARPVDQPPHDVAERRAERGERVLHPRRHLRVHRSANEPVPLQAAERHREHPLADAGDAPQELAEAQRALDAEHVDQGHRPFVADAREHLVRATVGLGVLELRRLRRNDRGGGGPARRRRCGIHTGARFPRCQWFLRHNRGTFACVLHHAARRP